MKVLIITSEWPSPEYPGSGSFIAEQVESLRSKINVSVFPFRGRRNPALYWEARKQLHKQLADNKPDLLHAHFGQSGLLAFGLKIPMVVTFHGSDLQGIVDEDGNYTWQGRVLQAVSKFVAKRARKIIVVSSRLRFYLPKYLPSEVIPCGINVQAFQPMDKEESRKKLNLPEDRKLVLFVGDPKNPVKRYSLAEKAVQLIAPSCKASLVAASGIAREKMPLYMNACDVFLMTSKHEGSPMVIKEAMSCNLPVVSVDVGDVRERLKNESNGIISGEDPAELAKNLEKILREDRRSEGRKAIQDCSLEAVAERLIKIYQAAVKGK